MKSHAPGESFNAKVGHVLDTIVRIGFYDGRGNPEDHMLPSVMRTLLEYLGDDCGLPGLGQDPKTRWQWSTCALMHGVSGMAFRFAWATYAADQAYLGRSFLSLYRDVLQAAGFTYDMILKPDFAAGLEHTGSVSTDEDRFRRRIVESIQDRKMPVIGLRIFGPPEPGVIAGFERQGEVILGWDHFQGMDEAKTDPRVSYQATGMFRKRDWFRDIGGIIVLTGRCPRPPAAQTHRAALVRAYRDLCSPGGERQHLGVSSYRTWIDLLMDGSITTADPAIVRQKHGLHHEAVGELAERRAYGETFLLQSSVCLPEAGRDLEQAACCYAMFHDMCWRVWQTVGDWRDPGRYDTRFADPTVRCELASLVILLRDLDLRATHHIHNALRTLGETELDTPPRDPGTGGWEGVRRIPYFSLDTNAFFGPATGTVNRGGVTMRVPAERLPPAEAEAGSPAGGLRWGVLAADDRMQRDRLTSDFVSSIFHGRPALVTYEGRRAIAVGYHIHTMNLQLVVPEKPEADSVEVHYLDPKLAGPVGFLEL